MERGRERIGDRHRGRCAGDRLRLDEHQSGVVVEIAGGENFTGCPRVRHCPTSFISATIDAPSTTSPTHPTLRNIRATTMTVTPLTHPPADHRVLVGHLAGRLGRTSPDRHHT